MKAIVDSSGRITIPKTLRDLVGLSPGTTVDVSPFGSGLALVACVPTARIIEENGLPVASGTTELTDEIVFELIDAGRR